MTETLSRAALDRRAFTRLAAGATGGLLLGVTVGCDDGDPGPPTLNAEPPAESGPRLFNAFIRIAPDDSITVINPSVEMGQGVDTALPQIVADELDARWDQMRVERAHIDAAYNNPAMPRPMQTTAASTSIRYFFEPMRAAAAAARDMLIRAAAAEWSVAPGACGTEAGAVVRIADGARLSYGALAEAASKLEPPATPRLKDPAAFNLIGQDVVSPAQKQKIDGSIAYTIDLSVPGLLHAALALAPVFGAELDAFDDSAARQSPGVRDVIAMKDGVAVVADRYWQARRALNALDVTFKGGAETFSSAEYETRLMDSAAAEPGVTYLEKGTLAGEGARVAGTYSVPYLAHIAMEPLSCIAVPGDGSWDIYSGTQNLTRSTDTSADFLGLPSDAVTIHPTILGGSFGRRLGYDLEIRAIEIARAVNAPVKAIWAREDDVRHDFYRPMVAADFKAALNGAGSLDSLEIRLAGQPWPTLRQDGMDPSVMGAIDEMPYDFPNLRLAYVRVDSPVPIGTWRSVPRSYNTLIVECIIDELAAAAGVDPYQFRRTQMKDDPRLLAVLDEAANRSGWGEPLPPGRGRGIAMWPCYGSSVAQVVEASVEDGQVRVHKVVSAVDCGLVVNPNIVRQQIEGAVIQALSATLLNEITVEGGQVVEGNFNDYQMLSLAGSPDIDTQIVSSAAAPTGIGEVGVPAVQPALVNAVYAATGRRIRALPLARHDFTAS